jgi:hypothetical protein
MIVFLGGKASGFRNLHDHDTYDADGTRFFQVCVNELPILVLLNYKQISNLWGCHQLQQYTHI